MKWGPSMIDYMATKPSSTPFALAIGAVMLTGNLQYPQRAESYGVQQERGTYSEVLEKLTRPVKADRFAEQMAAIYSSFTQRQERLGVEFEAAIFSDLESLYEA